LPTADAEAAVEREAALGDVEAGEDLEARDEALAGAGGDRLVPGVELALDAEPDARAVGD